MAARKLKIPFATSGDKTVVPDAVQPSGSVSFTQGFGYDYERDYSDPAAKDIGREDMNGILSDITAAIGEMQAFGAAEWSADGAPYAAGAMVYSGGKLYVSGSAGNSAIPPAAPWVEAAFDPASILAGTTGSATDKTMTQKAITDALALKVDGQADLTASAVLSGINNTITVTGIVAALNLEVGDVIQIIGGLGNNGRLHTVDTINNAGQIVVNYEHCSNRGNGPLKLVNYSGTITIKRIAKWHSAGIGVGQNWVDVLPVRAASTTYTNTTGRSIQVMLSGGKQGVPSSEFLINGSIVAKWGGTEPDESCISPLIPNGATYQVKSLPGYSLYWSELR